MTFSSKRKSVSSKTKSLCQRLPYQGSCRADARLRGWTKDAFRVSGITQVLLCTTSPSRLRRATSPSRGAFGIPQGLLLSPEALKSVCGESVNYSSSRRFLMTRVIAPPATTASIRMYGALSRITPVSISPSPLLLVILTVSLAESIILPSSSE